MSCHVFFSEVNYIYIYADCHWQVLSCVQLFATPWTVAREAPLSMGFFPGKNTGVGCHFLLQGIFLNQGSNLGLLHLLRWQAGRFFTTNYIYIWAILKYSSEIFMFKVILNFSLEKSTLREMVWWLYALLCRSQSLFETFGAVFILQFRFWGLSKRLFHVLCYMDSESDVTLQYYTFILLKESYKYSFWGR